MIKEEVSLTKWLYDKDSLEILKNLRQGESYRARIELLEKNLYDCTYGDKKDYNRCKDIIEAQEWWRKRYEEVFGAY